jgi:FOG: CheY-like receiver
MAGETFDKEELRIILIDDSPFDAELIELQLKRSLRCNVVVVDSRTEFLAELERAAPDVIISDSALPRFDGFAALALAQERCPEVPFIFCSGNQHPKLQSDALAKGVTAWVSKDQLERLDDVVRKILH